MKYTRDQLLEICRKAFVPQKAWRNRDSADAQKQIGVCYALLLAGCDFKILTAGRLKTDDWTIWVEISYEGFEKFEGGFNNDETFYLPTEKRLKDNSGGDWY